MGAPMSNGISKGWLSTERQKVDFPSSEIDVRFCLFVPSVHRAFRYLQARYFSASSGVDKTILRNR